LLFVVNACTAYSTESTVVMQKRPRLRPTIRSILTTRRAPLQLRLDGVQSNQSAIFSVELVDDVLLFLLLVIGFSQFCWRRALYVGRAIGSIPKWLL